MNNKKKKGKRGAIILIIIVFLLIIYVGSIINSSNNEKEIARTCILQDKTYIATTIDYVPLKFCGELNITELIKEVKGLNAKD